MNTATTLICYALGLVLVACLAIGVIYSLEGSGKRYRVRLKRQGHDTAITELWYVERTRFGWFWRNAIAYVCEYGTTSFDTAGGAADFYRRCVAGFTDSTVMYPLREIANPTQVPAPLSSLRFIQEAGFDPETSPNPKRKHDHLPQPPKPSDTGTMPVMPAILYPSETGTARERKLTP